MGGVESEYGALRVESLDPQTLRVDENAKMDSLELVFIAHINCISTGGVQPFVCERLPFRRDPENRP